MKIVYSPLPTPIGPGLVPVPAPPPGFEVMALIINVNDLGITPNAARISALLDLDPAGLIQLPIECVTQPALAGFNNQNAYLCPCHFVMGAPGFPGPFAIHDMAGIDLVTGAPVPPGSADINVHLLGRPATGPFIPGQAPDIKGVIKMDFAAVPTPLPTSLQAQGQMVGVGIYPLGGLPQAIGPAIVPAGMAVYGIGGFYNLTPAIAGERKIFIHAARNDGTLVLLATHAYDAGGWPAEQPVGLTTRFPAVDFGGTADDDIATLQVNGLSPVPAGENLAYGIALYPMESSIPTGFRAVVPLTD